MKKIIILALTLIAAISLAACNKNEKLETITVVATAVPHEEILIQAKPLLKEKGYNLQIQVISEYPLGNPAVASKSADANFFQHIPYLESYNSSASEDKKLVNVANVHIEPFNLYSGKKNSLDDLTDGDKIFIGTNQPDYGRIVQILKNAGLVTVIDNFDPRNDITHPLDAIKTKKVDFSFEIIQTELLVQARNNKEGDFFFINGNYALSGGLKTTDIVLYEPTNDNIYVNVLAVLSGNENTAKTKALVEVLTSSEIKAFITNNYNGAVIPA